MRSRKRTTCLHNDLRIIHPLPNRREFLTVAYRPRRRTCLLVAIAAIAVVAWGVGARCSERTRLPRRPSAGDPVHPTRVARRRCATARLIGRRNRCRTWTIAWTVTRRNTPIRGCSRPASSLLVITRPPDSGSAAPLLLWSHTCPSCKARRSRVTPGIARQPQRRDDVSRRSAASDRRQP